MYMYLHYNTSVWFTRENMPMVNMDGNEMNENFSCHRKNKNNTRFGCELVNNSNCIQILVYIETIFSKEY